MTATTSVRPGRLGPSSTWPGLNPSTVPDMELYSITPQRGNGSPRPRENDAGSRITAARAPQPPPASAGTRGSSTRQKDLRSAGVGQRRHDLLGSRVPRVAVDPGRLDPGRGPGLRPRRVIVHTSCCSANTAPTTWTPTTSTPLHEGGVRRA